MDFLLASRESEILDDHIKDVLDAIKGVIDFIRVLKDRLHLTPIVAHLLTREMRDVGAAIENLTRREGDESENRIDQRGLAAAALACDGGDGRRLFGDHQTKVLQRDKFLTAAEQAAAVDFRGVANFQKGRCHYGLISAQRTHATQWLGLTCSNGTGACLQISRTCGQRNWKMQPGGGLRKSWVKPPVTFKGLRSLMEGMDEIKSWV